jgi:hypothetical protein
VFSIAIDWLSVKEYMVRPVGFHRHEVSNRINADVPLVRRDVGLPDGWWGYFKKTIFLRLWKVSEPSTERASSR